MKRLLFLIFFLPAMPALAALVAVYFFIALLRLYMVAQDLTEVLLYHWEARKVKKTKLDQPPDRRV